MFCTNCGVEIKENATFCTSCGSRMNNTTIKESFAGNVTDREFVLCWNSYYFIHFLHKKENMRTIRLDRNCLMISKANLRNEPELVKTIDYGNIQSVECQKRPHIKIRNILFSIISFMIGIFMSLGDIGLLEAVLAVMFCWVFPCHICSTMKPVNVLIKEKNGKKTKLIAQKEYAETAEEIVRCINSMIGR